MKDHHTINVETSSNWQHAIDRFLDAIGNWTSRVIDAHPDGFSSDSHDGGTFMTSWVPYLLVTNDETVVDFMRRYRDDARQHFEETNQWYHGYWRRQEVHHGTEHFDIFLRALRNVHPNDEETVQELEDAAEHVGNWVSRVPEWFDRDTGLFRSFYLSTEHVGEPSCNLPDHIRMASLCVLAYEMTGKDRYLSVARQHGKLWATAITANPELPAAIDVNGPVYSVPSTDQETYQSFAGAAPDDLEQELSRAENLLASAMPDVMLALWQHTGEEIFHDAATKIIDVASEETYNPIAWQVHAAIRRYRGITHEDRYDETLKNAPDSALRAVHELTIVPEPDDRCINGPIGMRSDKPDWLDQGGRPAPSPLLIALRAVVEGDGNLMGRALDLAIAHFNLAQRVFGDVTHHGCGSQSLSAVCRGHGRLNGAGVVTEVLTPALQYDGFH